MISLFLPQDSAPTHVVSRFRLIPLLISVLKCWLCCMFTGHVCVHVSDFVCFSGLLHRRVMDCLSCQYEMYICPSPTGQQDCGGIFFICVCVRFWWVDVVGGSYLHSGSASFFRMHKRWKCVKQGAAACPRARLMKKITEVIQSN